MTILCREQTQQRRTGSKPGDTYLLFCRPGSQVEEHNDHHNCSPDQGGNQQGEAGHDPHLQLLLLLLRRLVRRRHRGCRITPTDPSLSFDNRYVNKPAGQVRVCGCVGRKLASQRRNNTLFSTYCQHMAWQRTVCRISTLRNFCL